MAMRRLHAYRTHDGSAMKLEISGRNRKIFLTGPAFLDVEPQSPYSHLAALPTEDSCPKSLC